MPLTALPWDILQHICSFLDDAEDLASCHMVDTRCAQVKWQPVASGLRAAFDVLVSIACWCWSRIASLWNHVKAGTL
jgi:hypothetical protein